MNHTFGFQSELTRCVHVPIFTEAIVDKFARSISFQFLHNCLGASNSRIVILLWNVKSVIIGHACHGALSDQIDPRSVQKDNFQYQKINKTTRCGFFDVAVKSVICSEMLPENHISADSDTLRICKVLESKRLLQIQN